MLIPLFVAGGLVSHCMYRTLKLPHCIFLFYASFTIDLNKFIKSMLYKKDIVYPVFCRSG